MANNLPSVSAGMPQMKAPTAPKAPSAMGGLHGPNISGLGMSMRRVIYGSAPKAVKGVERMPSIKMGKIR